MSGNLFSIGRDCQVVVIGPFGRVDLTHVTGFEARQTTQSVRVARMDGTQLGAELPRGWDGSFDIDRADSAADDMVAALEQSYVTSGQMPTGTLYQYVTETDGSVSTYQYDSVIFRLTSSGVWKGDGSVAQKLDFYAARRKRI